MPILPDIRLGALNPEDPTSAINSIVTQLNAWKEALNSEVPSPDIGEGSLLLKDNQLLLTKPSGTQVVIVGQQSQDSAVDEEGNFKAITGDSIEADSITANNIESLNFSGKNATFDTGTIGGFEMGPDYLRDVANSFGLASGITGGDDIRFWAGASFANRAAAPFKVTESGIVTASDGTKTFIINGNGELVGQVTDNATDNVLFDINQRVSVVYSEDSTTTLQDALDYLHDNGGGTLFIRNGTYILDSNIAMYDNITIEGETGSGVILDFDGNANQLQAVGTDVYDTGTVSVANGSSTVTGSGTTWAVDMVGQYIIISGIWFLITAVNSTTELEIESPFDSPTVAGTVYSIATILVGVTINNITIQNSTDVKGALLFENVSDGSIENVTIYDSTIGFNYINCSFFSSEDITTIGCGTGINVSHAGVWTFNDFAVYASTDDGMTVDRLISASISNATLSTSGANGISVSNSSNWGLYDMTITTNTGNGAELTDCSGIEMSNMDIQNNGGDGTKLTSNVDRSVMAFITFRNNGGFGVNIAASSDDLNTISSCNFTNNSSGSIDNSGTNTLLFTGDAPTVNDFSNAQHDHSDANDGGALADGIITPSKLDLDPATAIVSTAEGTTSSFPVDLATSGPAVTVNIGANGLAWVTLYCRNISSASNGSCQMGFAVSGANTIAAADNYSMVRVGDTGDRRSVDFLLTGLNPGSTTFTAKYGRGTNGTSTFQDRRIAVIPL